MPTVKQLDEVIATLASLCPGTFAVYEARRRPLKLKIHEDLAAALGEVEHLNAALGYYCRNLYDQRALKLGAARIDLAGNAVGEVDAEQAANAQKAIAGLRAAYRKRNLAKAQPEPPPVRDSLAALRAAAKRRQAA